MTNSFSGKWCVVWTTPGGPDFMMDQDDEGAPFVSLFESESDAIDTANQAFASDIWPFTIVELA